MKKGGRKIFNVKFIDISGCSLINKRLVVRYVLLYCLIFYFFVLN